MIARIINPKLIQPVLQQNFKLIGSICLALTLTGCQDESFQSRQPQFSSSKVVLAEDLTAAILESTPKIRNSVGSIEDPSSIPSSQLQSDLSSIGSPPTRPPQGGRFAQWLQPRIEVQARSAPNSNRNTPFQVDPLAQAHNPKDPLAPVIVTRGWQHQLNEERPYVLGFQK